MKSDFMAKWALCGAVIGSLVYALIIRHWVGVAAGLAALAATFAVDYINAKLVRIDPLITTIAYIFCIFSLVMGTMWKLYDAIWWWDLLMHVASGVILAVIGNMVLNKLTKGREVPAALRFLFVVGIACTGGVVWEIYEFTADSLLGLDTQVTALTGVADTMWDLITDFAGGVIAGIALILFGNRGR